MFPDMGLHDFDQLLLGDALIRYRHDFDNIVVVSHSEHIMLRVLRRIRETTDNEVEHTVAIQYDEVKVYYISNEYFARIGCKPNGTFDRRWPDGFFALRTQEL
jgi:predicted ATPase